MHRSAAVRNVVLATVLLLALAVAGSGGLRGQRLAAAGAGAALVAVAVAARWRRRQSATGGAPARVEVLASAPLSRGCALSLVEVDLCRVLVVHGPGGAQLCQLAPTEHPVARSPRVLRARRAGGRP